MFCLSEQIASTDQPPSYPKSVSPSIRQFLDACFNRVPEQRPTARRLLQHPVFSAIISAPEPSIQPAAPSRTINRGGGGGVLQQPICQAARHVPPVVIAPSHLCHMRAPFHRLVVGLHHHRITTNWSRQHHSQGSIKWRWWWYRSAKFVETNDRDTSTSYSFNLSKLFSTRGLFALSSPSFSSSTHASTHFSKEIGQQGNMK